MQLTVALVESYEDGGLPYVIGLYTTVDEENWDGTPPWYTDLVDDAKGKVAEIVLNVSDEAVRALFQPTPIDAEVVGS